MFVINGFKMMVQCNILLHLSPGIRLGDSLFGTFLSFLEIPTYCNAKRFLKIIQFVIKSPPYFTLNKLTPLLWKWV